MPTPEDTPRRGPSQSPAPAPGQPTSERVHGIFANIAGSYDLINILGSFGIDRLWRRRTVRLAELTAESEVLDLCAGTGDLTLALARQGRPRRVLGTDFVPEMLDVGRAKLAKARSRGQLAEDSTVVFAVADAQDLPFEDTSFDVATCAFGVRNLPDREANFREVLRILRPGGRYLILEFTRPPNAIVRTVYHFYLRTVLPALGGLIAGDRPSYQYLNDSIVAFPPQAVLADELRAAGFSVVRWHDLTFGIVAVHVAAR